MLEFWDLASKPSCSICSGLIEPDPNATEFFQNFEEWNVDAEYCHIPINDFRRELKKEKYRWTSAYRAVVKVGQHLPFVSGVGYRHTQGDVDGKGTFPVPMNTRSAIISQWFIWPEKEFIRIRKPHMIEYETSQANVGWLFHEMCWIMMELVNDEYQILNSDLDLLMRAVYDESMCRIKRKEQTSTQMDALQREIFRADIRINPFYAPGLDQIVKDAFDRPINGPKPQSPAPAAVTEAGFTISGGAFYKIEDTDIRKKIVGYAANLSEQDFRNLVLATGWRFGSEFWRKRIPDCFYEVHKGIGRQQVDWQWLGLEVGRYMERVNGLNNRVRIYKEVSRLLIAFALRDAMET